MMSNERPQRSYPSIFVPLVTGSFFLRLFYHKHNTGGIDHICVESSDTARQAFVRPMCCCTACRRWNIADMTPAAPLFSLRAAWRSSKAKERSHSCRSGWNSVRSAAAAASHTRAGQRTAHRMSATHTRIVRAASRSYTTASSKTMRSWRRSWKRRAIAFTRRPTAKWPAPASMRPISG